MEDGGSLSKADQQEENEIYRNSLETARKIMIMLRDEDPAIQIGGSFMAAVVLHQMYMSANDEESWTESSESAWAHREEIGFDLFGKPVTTVTH